MKDLLILLIVIMVVGAALCYIKKNSKKGIKCIGCPFASTCTSCKHSQVSKRV